MVRRFGHAVSALAALAALAALVAIVLGVPIVLLITVGNPWPGAVSIELRDEARIVIALLAVLAWVLWARFLVLLVAEIAHQLAERREERPWTTAAGRPSRESPAAPVNAGGMGVLAHRLVAAVMILLPALQSTAVAASGDPLPARPVVAAAAAVDPSANGRLADTEPAGPAVAERAQFHDVTVAPGDTLVGLARAHLGDAARWREIFELNRDRRQVDGGHLMSPSAIRVGWALRIPGAVASDTSAHTNARGGVPLVEPAAERSQEGGAAPAVLIETPRYVAPETITIEVGDNLWALSEGRLDRAGVDEPAATATYLQAVTDANADIVEDPNLIYPGERFDFPAIGTELRGRSAPPAAPEAEERTVSDSADERRRDTVSDPADERRRVTVSDSADERRRDTVSDPADERTDSTVSQADVVPVAPVVPAPLAPTSATSTSTTSTPSPLVDPPVGPRAPPPTPSPSPVGLGEVALLSTGVLALLAARRRARLRAARPRARIPEPTVESMATERLLRAVDARERLLRIDVAVRAAASSLVDGPAQIAVVMAGADGEVELVLTAAAHLPAPWTGQEHRWMLAGSIPVELLADAARSVGVPCVALVPLGVADDGRDVLVDLEALGVLAIDSEAPIAAAVVNGVAAALTSSLFAASANVVAVGVDESALLGHHHASFEATVEAALELAVTLVGTTASARQTTFALRTRHTSGEAWEPTIVVVGSEHAGEIGASAEPLAARTTRGIALVAGGFVPSARWVLRSLSGRWTLEPLGLAMTPVGLDPGDLTALYETVVEADRPLVDEEVAVDGQVATDDLSDAPELIWADSPATHVAAGGVASSDEFIEPEWSLLVRLLGLVDVVDRTEVPASFDRSKALELVAWLALHRDHATRTGARTALWALDVRDSTFANVVSDARRAVARLVEPAPGEEWLGRTLTELLPVHRHVITDADLVRARLDHARLQPPELAIRTLRPAVELIRGMPFAGTGFLWPDAEGLTSNLVLLATSAAAELAGHHLSMGDVDGVFWATGRGLGVLPAHEELIGLRMRAHAQAGDLAGVRLEWESYERVLHADQWSDGQPAEKLAVLRRQLLS